MIRNLLFALPLVFSAILLPGCGGGENSTTVVAPAGDTAAIDAANAAYEAEQAALTAE